MRRARTWMTIVGLLGSFAVAAAQEGPEPPPATEPPPEGEPQGQERPLTPAEQLAAGKQVVTQGEMLSKRVQWLLDQARRESDIIRVNCLNAKLAEVNANLRTAGARLEALEKAVDPDRRTHEYTLLTVLGKKFQLLEQETGQCVGQDMFDLGATRIVTEIDESTIPDESPDDLPMIMPPSNVLLVTPPPPASGIL